MFFEREIGGILEEEREEVGALGRKVKEKKCVLVEVGWGGLCLFSVARRNTPAVARQYSTILATVLGVPIVGSGCL